MARRLQTCNADDPPVHVGLRLAFLQCGKWSALNAAARCEENIMKRLTIALITATASTALIAPGAMAQSQDYRTCVEEREDRQVAGAIIGGLLGAVIGNELADDSNNNRAGRHHRGRGRGHHRRGRHHRDRGNAEEVGTIAGLGVGALIGAGIASGEECDRYANRHYPGKPPAPGYDDSYYADPNYRDDGSRYASDQYGYDDGYGSGSSTDLIGGRTAPGDARLYRVSSGDWNCDWTSTRRLDEYGQVSMEQVYMCQGSDGIWRPSEAYN
jgi:hypothetical protein